MLGNKKGELAVFEFVHKKSLLSDGANPIYIGLSREETLQNLRAIILRYCMGELDVSTV